MSLLLTAVHRSAGIPQVSLPNWLSTTFNPAPGQTGIKAEYDSGLYASDDLLARVQADLGAFYWQSHTLSHLSRDNLGKNDCDIEDGGQPTFVGKTCDVYIVSDRVRADPVEE